jgi:hypothetical protein
MHVYDVYQYHNILQAYRLMSYYTGLSYIHTTTVLSSSYVVERDLRHMYVQ